MITRGNGFPYLYGANDWVGRSGKAGFHPTGALYYQRGGMLPAGAIPSHGAQKWAPSKPNLMMDPSDPSTWTREYRFDG